MFFDFAFVVMQHYFFYVTFVLRYTKLDPKLAFVECNKLTVD